MKVKSVTQLVNQIKQSLETEYQQEMIEGEISNFSYSAAGHYYFTLSDTNSSISAAMFKGDALRNPVIRTVKNGQKIICAGPIGVYTRRGTFQLIAKKVMLKGKGDLKEQFELLKKKLSAEGLFDIDKKKPIPAFPKKVAVITAKKAAALQDFINVYERRSVWMDLTVVEAFVQGDHAAPSIIEAIDRCLSTNSFDIIVITRGGGSLEDLWAFNDEALARKIFDCPIPIVSAIGHEVDYTICDFVADYRCETPTAAAELLTQSQVNLSYRLNTSFKFLHSLSKSLFQKFKDRLKDCSPVSYLEVLLSSFHSIEKRLSKCTSISRPLELLKIHEHQYELDNKLNNLEQSMENKLLHLSKLLENKYGPLQAMNPRAVLGRGYTFLTDKENKVVATLKEFSQLPLNEAVNIHFQDGEGVASVLK